MKGGDGPRAEDTHPCANRYVRREVGTGCYPARRHPQGKGVGKDLSRRT